MPVANVSDMRVTALALLFLATAVFADGRSKRIEASLARGEKALAAAHDHVKGTKLLRALEAAKPHFKRARSLAARGLEGAPGDEALAKAHADATNRLVAILNAETVIYLGRGNLSLAVKRNAEALALLPEDVRAKMLEDEVKDPEPAEVDATPADEILRSSDAFGQVGSLGAVIRNRRVAERRHLEQRATPAR